MTKKMVLGRIMKETEKAILFESAKLCVNLWFPKQAITYHDYGAFECTHAAIIPKWLFDKSRNAFHPFYVNDVCEMCEQSPSVETINVQTIPGSFDTKFIDMKVCANCASDYQNSLSGIWNRVGVL